MDPQDPKNPGGLQAKSGGKEGGKKPGKVAGTDHYGQGGPEGKGSTPGKHSGTEHLPDGQNGDSKAALNAGKFGGGAGNQTPPVQPKGKEVATPVKAKKAGAAAPKVDTGAARKKGKGAPDAKVDAAPHAQVTHTPTTAFHAPAAEPPKMMTVPDVASPEPVVVAPPAKGKVDPTHAQLASQVASISTLIKSSHDEILAVSKQLQQQLAGQLDTYAVSIDQKVDAGVKRVGAAYDGVDKSIADAATHANEEITKREKSIPDAIKAARDKKAGEIKNHVNDAKLAAHAKVTQGPQVAAAKAAALQFADSIKTKHAALENKIKTDTSPGGAIAGQLNPKKYSAQVQQAGAGARAVGLQALAEDKRLALITTQANAAIKFIKGVLDPKEQSYRTQSGIIIQESLGAADKDLDQAVAQHEPEQKKQLDDAAELATKTLHKQVETQRAGITNTQKQATTKLAQDRKAAEDGAHKAGKTLSEDVKHGSKEIQNQIAKKAAQDASSYSKLTAQLRQLGQAKKLDEPTKAKLEAIRSQLEQAHGENKKTLEELAASGLTKLRSSKEQQFEQAIQTYEAAAAKTKTDLVNSIGSASTDLGKSFDSIGTSFDSTVEKSKQKLKIELDFYAQNTETVPATYATGLDKQLTNVVNGLAMTADKMLEPMKFQAKLDKESEPAIKTAMKTGPEDAQGLWDAMDGIGTDENKIYGILRKASPGEIIFIEGCYNDAYSKRATDKYPSPLRADLDDELSGSEWDIAFAYLRHEREKALTLELNNSTHWYNDEEDRIEEVLRSASEDEMKNLVSSPEGKAAIANVKDHLGDCDLDVVETLTNTDIPFADRKVKADAIRVYDAMYGGLTGIGTDEAKIKQKLEACKTKEEREALHKAYNEYIAKKDPLKVAELKEQNGGKDVDLMDASFDDEMSGGEWTYVRALSETKLDDKEHDATVKMAKLVDGAQGGGTDENKMYEALEDEDYAAKYAAAKPEDRPALAKAHEEELNKRLEYLTKNGMMTKSFKGDKVADIISGEMGDSYISFEELKDRKWDASDKRPVEKRGKPIDNIGDWQQYAQQEMLNLEQMVAQRTLQAGKAEPELMIAYACWGVTGTDEETLKKALKKGGEPRTKSEIQNLRAAFTHAWGVDLMDGTNELDRKDFKEPTGVVPSELDGKDWLEVRIALMGKPTTPAEVGYVDNVRYRFVTTGSGSPSPFSHAREDMENNHQRLQDEVKSYKNPNEEVVKDKPGDEGGGSGEVRTLVAMSSTAAPGAKETKGTNPAASTNTAALAPAADPLAKGKTTSDPGGIDSASHLEGSRLEILAGYAEKSEMAFLEAKEAMANAIITVVEIIGAALITAASMGASSPMLVMFIGNLILSGMTIMMRKDMVGDAYGAEDMGIDAIKAVVMAAIAAAGEAKVVSDFAGKAGKLAGKTWDVFAGGAEKAGMKVVGTEGLAVAEGAAKKLTTEVTSAAKSLGTKEAEKVGTHEVVNTAEKTVGKEATETVEKVGTKEVTNTAEKVGTKEVTNTAEKAGAEHAAEEATAKQAAKKSARDHFVDATKAGTKNATNAVMQDSADFFMDEKTYDMKFWEALVGEHGIGARLLKKIPSAFAQGAMQDYIQGLAGNKGPEYLPHARSGSEAVFRSILSEIGGNTAGFLTYLDNYSDASTFWIELLKTNARSVASGGFNGIAGHTMRAKGLARELAEGQKTGEPHEALAKIKEAIGYMKPEEMSNLANHVAQMNPAAVELLPPEYKKLINKQTTAGANVTGPKGDTAPITNHTDEKAAVAKKEEKAAVAPAVDEKQTLAPTETEKKAAQPVTTSDEEKKVAGAPHDEKAAAKPEEKPAVKAEEKSASDKDGPPKKESTVATGGTLETGASSRATTKDLEHETTNHPETTARAHAALENLKPNEQHAVRQIMGGAENDTQRAMLERALASGRKPEELESLRAAMKGLSAEDVATRFTGAGVVQFYQQSCVPTAYQIAIADMDPYYAFDLRNHPEKVMAEQRKALADAGSLQTKRNDLQNGGTGRGEIADHAAEEGGMAKALHNPDSYSKPGDTGAENGMSPTKMEGTDLHKQLETATGQKYEVLVNQKFADGYEGADSYKNANAPHERIMAALDQRLPVIISKVDPIAGNSAHAIVLIGYETDARGNILYHARDPQTGHVTKATMAQLGDLPTITLPAGAGRKKVEGPKPTTDDKTTAGKPAHHDTTPVGGGTDTPTAPRELHDAVPGKVPTGLTEKQLATFNEANAAYERIKSSPFGGEEFARAQWARMINESDAGLKVPSPTTHAGERAQAETAKRPDAPKAQHASEGTLEGSVGNRATTDPKIAKAVAEKAFAEIASNPAGFKVVEKRGEKIVVEIGGNPPVQHELKLVVPDHLPEGQIAGFARDTSTPNETLVWVSQSVPNDQAVRALNGVIAQAVAQRKMEAGAGSVDPKNAGKYGQLGGMLEHLENVKKQESKPVTLEQAKAERVKNAHENAQNESPARVSAEIDLMLHQMGIDRPGEAREHALADMEKMDPRMAAKVREHLEKQVAIGFRPDAVETDPTKIAKPKHATDALPESEVLGGTPKNTHAYSEADKGAVLELRAALEQIKEIDTRLKQRDQQGTQDRDTVIAKGESMRRRELVEQTKALMEKLQLGGIDPKYYQERLAELERVFPGVKDQIAPAVMDRVNKRNEANDIHLKAAAAAKQQQEHAQTKIKGEVMAEEIFMTDRVVIGDGVAGLSDVATLGYKPGEDGFLDPKHCLVLGGADLVTRMADADPTMRWGQRADLFDSKEGPGHVMFRGEDGKGNGNLRGRAEDGGEFVSVGELRDAMDLARQKMGVARLDARVEKVELKSKNPGDWHSTAEGYDVRLTIIVDGKKKIVYARHTDVTTGLGQAQLPDEAVLNPKDRNELFKNKAIVSGEDIMTTKDREALKDKKVLVLGYGPTGGWAAVEAKRRGGEGANVDWAGASGQPHDHDKSNKSAHAGLSSIDRVSEALDPAEKVNITTDRIFTIKSQGKGAEVTYMKPNGETYTVKYDLIVSAISPDNTNTKPTTQSDQASAGKMLDGIDMRAQKGTNSPTLESDKGEVRLIGASAAEGVGLKDDNEKREIDKRRKALLDKNSADSPDHRVFEFAGAAAEQANKGATGLTPGADKEKTTTVKVGGVSDEEKPAATHNTPAGTTKANADEEVAPVAKHQQESNPTRHAEIHLGQDKPASPPTEHEKSLRGELDHLAELREHLKKAKTPDEQAALKSQIDEARTKFEAHLKNPANKDALLDPSVAFALAREANSGESAELAKFMRTNVDEFRKSQDQARQGVDPQLRAKREVFEREIGKAILGGELKERVDSNLQLMCDKAIDYINKLPSDRRDKALISLGSDATGGYAGAVLGKDASKHAQTMMDVLTSGNPRERMIALSNFPKLVTTDMHQNPSAFEHVASQASGKPGEFGPAEVAAYKKRFAEYQADQAQAGADPSSKKYLDDFLKPLSSEKAGSQKEYQTAKKQEMDTKLPNMSTEVPADAEGLFHQPLPQSPNEKVAAGNTGAGEQSSLARTSMTIAEAEAMGYQLSPRERQVALENGGRLPWIVGTVANVVDPNAKFINDASQLSLPQKAGISGTTFRFMEAASLLGGKPAESRLAMIGALEVIDAHTVYEIASASKGFGLQFDPSRPYDHLDIPRDVLERLAKASGTSLAELNGETKANTPAPGKTE